VRIVEPNRTQVRGCRVASLIGLFTAYSVLLYAAEGEATTNAVRVEWPTALLLAGPSLVTSNAYPVWSNAAARVVGPELMAVRRRFFLIAADDAPFPDGDVPDAVAEWVDRSQSPLEQLEEGLHREACRFPARSNQDPATEQVAAFRDLARLKFVRGKLRLRRADLNAALKDFDDLLGFGAMVLDGGGATLHFLAGVSICEMGLRGMRMLAMDAHASEALRMQALERLREPPDLDQALGRALQVEFHDYVLYHLRSVPEDPEALAAVFDEVGDEPASFRNMLAASLAAPGAPSLKDGLLKKRFQRLIRLSDRPFDRALTATAAADVYAGFVQAARSGWGAACAALAETDARRADLVESHPVLARYLHDRDAEVRNRDLEQVENPIGVLVLASVLDVGGILVQAPKLRTDYAAVSTVIALRIYRARHGGLPASLDLLVADGILPAVPEDAFSGAALKYAAGRARLWSVGADGRDDGGTGGSGSRWQAPDAVWRVE
jgi:hypothetical protein